MRFPLTLPPPPRQNEIKDKLQGTRPGGPKPPRFHELKAELSEIKSQVSTRRTAQKKIDDQIASINNTIAARIKELTTKKSTLPFRTLDDLEAEVRRLDRQVSTGQMKIVDEKKALQAISNLNRRKKDFAAFEEVQATIDADREKIKTLRDQKSDPEIAKLNARYDEKNAELQLLTKELDEK